VFVFNADSPEIRSELSFVMEPEGSLIHASLLAGELSIHRIWADQYNPFSVPLQEPLHLEKVPMEESKYSALMNSAEDVLKLFSERAPRVFDMEVVPGNFSDSVSASAKPWRGYWWPRKGQSLSNGSSSPLGKYDRYVEARTGNNP